MIIYQVYKREMDNVSISDGFFHGWPNPPSKEKYRQILENSYVAIVAIDDSNNEIIGFINAIGDGILSAYIPLLEVLPDYQRQGIGKNLVRKMLGKLSEIYMVDLSCDEELQPFYEKLGMMRSQGMMLRNYNNQSGRLTK